jgi:hypothetical protein
MGVRPAGSTSIGGLSMSVCSVPNFRARSRSFIPHALVLALLFIGIMPAPALAQGDADPHFGVSVSFSPSWKSRDDLLATVGLDEIGTIKGTEFTIGFVRGRTLGGDWGVSFVRKPFKDTTAVSSETDSGQCGTGCTFSNNSTRTTTFDAVYLRGVELHWAPVFVTVRNRVQVGMNVAGGIAFPEGTIRETFQQASTTTFNGQTFTNNSSDSFTSPAKEVLYGKVPLFKVEAQGAVILAPGLKVKVAGGLNNPGMGIRIAAVYLIGAN